MLPRMRSDIAPGGTFPDYELSGHDKRRYKLSGLQGIDPMILILSLYGLLVSTRSLQRGKAVPVIAVTSAGANAMTIAAGPIGFGEPMPSSTFGLVIRLLAFVLVVTAAALTPPPQPREEAIVA